MTPSYDDAEFHDALDRVGPHTTTHAIAEIVGCTPTTANRRLKTLAEEDALEFMAPYPDYYDSTSQNLVIHVLGPGEEPLSADRSLFAEQSG